jgi:hypothetical protein
MDPLMNSSVARHLAQVVIGSGLIAAASTACTGSVAGHTVATKPDRPAASGGTSAPVTPIAGAPVLASATSGYTGPHFSTPEAAMQYLTSAYNGDAGTRLHAVTTPQAFRQLTAMRSEAIDLQVQSCVPSGSGRGDYVCTFRHDYPASLHKAGHGSSRILVAPAQNPGWYMYTLLDCG